MGCPERITWLEGTEASLSCVAHGVPPPNVSCVRSGEAGVVEGLLHVVREHAGTYRCEATNDRGSAAKNVAVTSEPADFVETTEREIILFPGTQCFSDP